MRIKFSPRHFVSLFIAVLILFITYHVIVWYLLTSKIFNISPYYAGDLGRMSYQVNSLFPRIEGTTLPRHHFNGTNWEKTPIDMITIGDSFSNGMGSGKNPYYQDYLATVLHINILNIQNLDNRFSYIDTIRYLHRHQWLHKVHPKAILIECVARETLNHIPSKNTQLLLSPDELNTALFKTTFTREFPKTMLINTGNYKAPYYYLKYKYAGHAKKEIYRFPLTKKLFTSKDTDHLLVYHDDINAITGFDRSSIAKFNNELNTLAHELHQDGITLLFMPAVDKYDLYYDYIKNRGPYPVNPFFTLLRKEKKEYIFIDTKKILSPLLEQNVSNVYYPDDTNWSYIGSEMIANDRVFAFLKNKEE